MTRVDITYPGDTITKSITALVKQSVSPSSAPPIDIGLVEINHPTAMIPGPPGPVGPQGPAGGALVGTGDSLPPEPQGAEIFWESDSGKTYIWYDDGDSAQWVQITGIGGSTSSDDGPWVTPQMYGADGDGVADDTSAFQDCLDSAVAGKAPVYVPAGTYKVSQLVITAGSVIRASQGAVIRSDGTTTGVQHVLTLSNNVDFDRLVVSIPGTETTATAGVILIGDNVRGDLIRLTSDIEYAGNVRGILSRGQDVRIGRIETVNIDNAVDITNDAAGVPPTTGLDLGFVDITCYRRGLFLVNLLRARVGGLHTRKRAASATAMLPGQNGILIGACAELMLGDCYIEDSSEHSIRIGGSFPGYPTRDVTFGNITTVNSRGCTFKLNDGVNRIINVQTGNILAVDTGGDGGNQEILRLCHCGNVSIGNVLSVPMLKAASGQYGLITADALNVNIASLGGKFFSGHIGIDSTTDTASAAEAGDVIGLRIGRLHGTMPGSTAIAIGGVHPYNVGDIHIHCDGLSGFTTNLSRWIGGGGQVLTGVIRLTGWVSGTVAPAYQDVPDSDDFQVDITWNGKRMIGRGSVAQAGSSLTLAPPVFSPASGPVAGITIYNQRATAGAGLFGGAIEWTRLDSSRRAAAIVSRQTSADNGEHGIDFYVCDVSSVSNETLALAMRLNAYRRIELEAGATKFADNAAAIAGGLAVGTLYWTATGEARIVV